MGLIAQTSILVACVVFFSCAPTLFGTVRKYSQWFFLMGTGAMFGLCFFDLLPEVIERGGKLSLAIIVVMFVLYTLVHGVHHKHDGHQPFLVLFASLLVHCFASGMFLVISNDFSVHSASAMLLALCVHKSYEALMFSFILINRQFSSRRRWTLLAFYTLSLPLGIATTALFKGNLGETLATVLSSFAAGSLIGCLIFDFLVPSTRHLNDRRFELAFLVLGLVLTQLVMRGV